ncbi:MAG TPA: FtsX-like permease family protein, partial [Pyrinomonadaceae bacterium]|nr:FtsX-like permease family protein [Pyrinomonadaceae bacterium]
REIGIRMALGAQPRDVLKQVIKQGMTMAVIGMAVGCGLSLSAMRLIASQLYGVNTSDLLTFTVAAAILLATGMLACLVPARRAAKVDLLEALRYE